MKKYGAIVVRKVEISKVYFWFFNLAVDVTCDSFSSGNDTMQLQLPGQNIKKNKTGRQTWSVSQSVRQRVSQWLSKAVSK